MSDKLNSLRTEMDAKLLSKEQIKEIISSKKQFADYVSAALVSTIAIGVRTLQTTPDLPPSAIAAFGEFLRKVRADLVGSNQTQMPTMLVNIDLGKVEKEVVQLVERGNATHLVEDATHLVEDATHLLREVEGVKGLKG